jgi:vacuolar-type H+-ATPase subunit E/Vma4
MNDLSRLSREDLKKILDETDEHIGKIRAELEQREQREQHEAIDSLELHFERSQVNWMEVKAFFQQVLAELKGKPK